ncbi:phosphatase PAP2 family protein [Paenibacillus chondroitinus]|uniref:Phosphatase PAP2 family protein n=1 Tax=Paenibacillus chondroitinus TaxID=59842 RepID=A0ABU6DI73_9BACL|nr:MULTISPECIES: phosphatase PAP2 family protein [Paenibacillus]MCY9657637.1 phosphatase PAP2 family protein [Paenibacillus anseongense]MEB4797364.1 phosphatase PAP2 family protein [Paenibacillus chondroitinus]
MQGKPLYKDLVWGLGAASVLLIGFVILWQSLSSSWLQTFDAGISSAIQSLRSDGLTPVVIFITTLGKAKAESIVFVVVAAILLFKWKQRWETLVLFIGVLATWGLNILIKGLIERERPVGPWLIEETGFSFPSGHAMVSILFYGLIGYLIWINVRSGWKAAWLVPVVTVVFVLCIGASRIYLGVHYPSDVLAGFTAGGAALSGCILAIHRITDRKARVQQGMNRSNRSGYNHPA